MHMPSSEASNINQKPTEQRLEERKQRIYETMIRGVLYAIATAALGAILVLAAGGGFLAVADSFVISGILGAAIAIIQSFNQHVLNLESNIEDATQITQDLRNSYKEEISRLNAENSENQIRMSKLIDDFNGLVLNAATNLNFYITIRRLLNSGLPQRRLIQSFLDEAMSRPIFTQPMKEAIFYELAQKGIEQCIVSWQAIHQGPISNLPRFAYLEELKETGRPLKKQRIVILNEKEYMELEDYNKVDRFLRHTEGTDSYSIKEDVFYSKFEVPSKMRLDDAALHDGKLLILRSRETQLAMLALEGHGDRAYEAIVNAFISLNWDIISNQLGSTFKIIERPTQKQGSDEL